MTLKVFKSIGIFGGTFDPVHFGHLRTALELYENLDLNEMRFIPCCTPVLKKPSLASASARLQMLKLAIEKQNGFIVDDREIIRDTPSYMVPTLESLRDEFPDASFYLIMGCDAFAQLNEWHRWEELLDLAHIVVAARTSNKMKLPDIIQNLLIRCLVHTKSQLQNAREGYIYFTKTTLLEISATRIRKLIAENKNPRFFLPENVYQYILANGIYKS